MIAALRGVWSDGLCRALVLAGMALHLALALSFHLSPDETHYALYAIHPQWSYFDHPPMAGWLQWPFAKLALALGGSDLAMRLLPMLCWALAALGMAALAQVMWPQARVARWALVVWSLMPIGHLMGLALVPDVILMPILCLAMFCTWRLCESPANGQDPVRNTRLWLGLGLALGLAGLSKYTAVFMGLGAVLMLLWSHGPRLLLQPRAWLAAGLALLLITPVLGWNAANGWISLAYQSSHARGSQAWQLRHVLVFAVVQVLGYGLLTILGAWVAQRTLRASSKNAIDSVAARGHPYWSILQNVFRISICFGILPLLIMAYLAGRGSALPHWSVTAWLALVPLAAIGANAWWQGARKGWLRGLAAFQLLCCLALPALMWSAGLQSEHAEQARSQPGQEVAGTSFNPFTDLYGWDAAARRARELADAHLAEGRAPTLAVMNWTTASRIAWYAQRPTKVVQIHLNQFGLWWGRLQPGEHALVVDWSQQSFNPPVGPQQFARCRLLEQQAVQRLGRQVAHFNFQLCENWQGRPRTPTDTSP